MHVERRTALLRSAAAPDAAVRAQGPLYGRTLPLCATTVTEKWMRDRIPRKMALVQERLRRIPNSGNHSSTGPDILE